MFCLHPTNSFASESQLRVTGNCALLQAALDGLTSFTGEESPRHRNYGFGVQSVKVDPPDSEQYVNVGGRNLVGLYLTVWVRKPFLPHISSWQVPLPPSSHYSAI
jgi:hypothetical protein